jgi:hypothetical protein
LLLLQPFFSLSLIKAVDLRERLAVAYVFWVLALGRLTVEETRVGKSGHLEWGFFKGYSLFMFGWFFFLLIGPIYVGLWIELSLALLLLLLSMLLYRIETRGSLWCWFIHLLFLYYACILLLILPFCF